MTSPGNDLRRDRDFEVLQSYIDVLSDIRRSSVMICDTIRVRENKALSVLGVDTGSLVGVDINDNEPIRCPICMAEFEHPTVAITTCGHGMHKGCMEEYLKKHDDGSEDGRQVFGCPLCRTRFRKTNILQLISMYPPTGQAMIWRAVQLCSPWKVTNDSGANMNSSVSESTLGKLYLSLRNLFKQTNNWSHVFESVMRLYEDVVQLRSDAMSQRNRMALEMSKKKTEMQEKWQRKMEQLDRREASLVASELQNDSYLGRCMRAVKREETAHLDLLESILEKQEELERTRADVIGRQREVAAALKKLESERRKQDDVMKDWEKKMKEERRRVALQRTSLMINSQRNGENSVESSGEVDRIAVNPEGQGSVTVRNIAMGNIAEDENVINLDDDVGEQEANQDGIAPTAEPRGSNVSNLEDIIAGRKRYRIE